MADELDESNNHQSEERASRELIKKVEAELRSDGLGPAQLGPAQIEKVVRTVQRVTIQKRHRGPLPSADEFAAYEAVFPGAAKEILDMAVRQQKHAHDCDLAAIKGELSYRWDASSRYRSVVISWRRGHLCSMRPNFCCDNFGRHCGCGDIGWCVYKGATSVRSR